MAGGSYSPEPWDTIESAPGKFGCEIIARLELDLSYEFDIVLLVRELATGMLYAAHDSGCSCPIPFEDLKSLSDWVPVTKPEDVEPVIAELYDPPYTEVDDFRRRVRQALVDKGDSP